MIQSQLGDTDSNSLLDLDGQVQALRMELEEVKEADDEEIERLLDQNGTGCLLQMASASALPFENTICICCLTMSDADHTWKTVNLSWAVCLQPNFNWLCWAHMQRRSKLNRSVGMTNVVVNAHNAKHPWQGCFEGHCILLLMTARFYYPCARVHITEQCAATACKVAPHHGKPHLLHPTCYQMQ